MNRLGAVVAVVMFGCGPQIAPPPIDPCGAVTCGEGRCVVVDGAPACLCAAGYAPQGLSCAAIPPVDLCASNPCASLTNSLCQVTSGRVSCVCPATRVEVNGSCVLRTACLPNPCTQPRRATCELTSGTASCRCDPGYAPEGDGCSAAPLWNCAAQHLDGDAAEPDECPTLARPLSIALDEFRTLEPAGDHDWHELGITPGHLFTVTASSTSLPLLLEVFDHAGLTLLASDNRALPQAEVTFVAPAGQSVMLRVRSVRATATGSYTIRYSDFGVDDYANTTAGALTLVPGAGAFSGAVQYAGDLDVVWLESPPLTAVRLSMLDGGPARPDLQIEVARPDGGTRLLSAGEATTFTTPTVESLSLTARGRNPRAQGDFQLLMEDLGPDDHSDDPAFGTPLATDDVAISGRIERNQDTDSFRVEQMADRLYRLRWQAQGFTPSAVVLLASGQVINLGYSYGVTGLVWKAAGSLPASVRLSSSYGSTALTYSVAVEDLGFDDHSDTVTAATPLAVGTPIAGRLELSTDIDTFSFTATAGHIFQAAATVTGTGATTLRVRVLDSTGAMLGEGDGLAGALVATTGTYRAQVLRGGYSSNGDLQRYSLTVTDQGTDDHAGTSAGATALTVGTPIGGSVQYTADVDAFAFTPIAGHVYAVSCARTSGTCSFQVKDPSGVVVPSGGGFLAATAGRWIVEVSGGSYSSVLGPYTLTVTDQGAEDHGGTAATATPLTLGTATSGVLAFQSDIDVFSFSGVAGHIYAVTLGNSSVRAEVRDSANALVSTGYYSGSTTSFLAASGGTFYVLASGYYSSTSLSYSVMVVDRGVDDHSNTSTGATALPIDTSAAGDIQFQGDLDFFSVTAVAGHHHKATCTPTGGSCTIAVFDAAGNPLANNYGNSASFKPPATLTTFFVRVSSSSESARYSVSTTDLGADDHGDTRADATPLVIDALPTGGVLEIPSDVDVFSVTAAAGDIVAVSCVVVSGSACALTVSTPAGGTVMQSSSAVSSSTGFLATTAGVYLVQVRGNGYGTTAASFTVRATRSSDDFTTTTAITRGTPINGAINYVGDTDVFSLSLTQGVPVTVNISSGSRLSVTSPTGLYVANVYGGYGTTFSPTVTGTYLLTVQTDSYYGVLSSYTLSAQ